MSCYGDALKLLGRRDLSVADLRGRLADREHPADEIEDAVTRLLAEVFADTDERALIDRAIQKKLRGGARPKTMQERARLYQFLMRQGFTPTGVSAAMRRMGMGSDD